MVKVARIEGATNDATAPKNWDRERRGSCGTLPLRIDNQDGVRFLRSAWEIERPEIGWLLAGSTLQIGLSLPRQPLMQVGLGPVPIGGAPAFTVTTVNDLSGGTRVRVEMFAPAREDGKSPGGTAWAEADYGDRASFLDGVRKCFELALAAADTAGMI